MDTHNKLVGFGKYKAWRWTNVPISFLKKVANGDGDCNKIADAELERRGFKDHGDIELTMHALNKASITFFNEWREMSENREGIVDWVLRVFREALMNGKVISEGEVKKDGITYRYDVGNKFITLISMWK